MYFAVIALVRFSDTCAHVLCPKTRVECSSCGFKRIRFPRLHTSAHTRACVEPHTQLASARPYACTNEPRACGRPTRVALCLPDDLSVAVDTLDVGMDAWLMADLRVIVADITG